MLVVSFGNGVLVVDRLILVTLLRRTKLCAIQEAGVYLCAIFVIFFLLVWNQRS